MGWITRNIFSARAPIPNMRWNFRNSMNRVWPQTIRSMAGRWTEPRFGPSVTTWREEWLYVVESNARRISRLRVQPDGSLTDREIFGPPDLGGIPDGFAFDAYGNLWVTLVMYDRLIAITPEGEVLRLLDDGNPTQVAELDRNYHARTMTPELMLSTGGTLARWMASVTFGGADLRTVYLGSLMGTTIPYFRGPVAGLPMVHWHERRAP
jgi:gluconolactonase